MANLSSFELNAMDNILPRYFHSGLWAFKLKDGVTQEQVVAMLCASFKSASVSLPLLTRRAFNIPPSPENPRIGRLRAVENGNWAPEIQVNDLSSEWPDYEELMEEGLPQDMLDGNQLLPASRFETDLDEAGTPLLVAQANFVNGGLLLCISLFHALMDGMSLAFILRTLALHMRMQQNEGDAPEAIKTVPDSECCDYNTMVKVWENAGSPVKDASADAW